MTRAPTRVLGPGDAAYAGQKHYTPGFLKIYDPLVLGLFSRVCRCPSWRILEAYERHVGRRHLDVGPGTGYFLERIEPPPDATATLLDPNLNVLSHASERLAHLDVETVEADVLQPLPDLGPFDSIGLNYVLHCLPGPMAHKASAIANLLLYCTRTAFCSAPPCSGNRMYTRDCHGSRCMRTTGGGSSTTSPTRR